MNDTRTPPADMLAQAQQVIQHAYCPYSNYPVAACVRASDGSLYAAANVENAAYNLCSCAETNAIVKMHSHGQHQLNACVVLVTAELPATPCGACRQRLFEFALPNTPVYCVCANGSSTCYSLQSLVPQAFGPNNMETS